MQNIHLSQTKEQRNKWDSLKLKENFKMVETTF